MEMLMFLKSTLSLALVSAMFAAAVFAQQPGMTGGTVVTSEPGKAAIVRTVESSAQVVGLEKATRTVTLKGPKGDPVDVVASDEVKNFDQIQIGDFVVARYIEAVTLELRKTGAGSGQMSTREEVTKAKLGERPAVAGTRQTSAVAEVTAVDPQASTITLKGPRGNELTLAVQNPAQFEVVRVGDHVEVTYTEALALSVEPAPGAAAKQK
jgi:hypothetical protein